MRRRSLTMCALLVVMTSLGGCVRRTLTVTSDPPGALVYLNGLEVGRTPLTRDFTWYGTYDVVLRKEGYETLKTTGKVIAPWWQWVPIDLFAEIVPFGLRDEQQLSYAMTATPASAADPQVMVTRAKAMQGQLESSERTRAAPAPTTATVTTTRPAR